MAVRVEEIAGKPVKVETLAIKSVPTNVITGFLGVGKTTAILHLLKHKPPQERWAVLVNEFGEIGLDGSLLGGKHSQQQGVFIREVPGGCMCCASGLPMQIALNLLLIKAKPDRLLIEPTGLGHPKEVLNVLSSKHYTDVLLLQKTITLVDARNLSDERYTSHETFNQQIAVADIVVGNKADLYQNDEKASLMTYVGNHGSPHVEVTFCQQGEIPISLLQGETSSQFLISDGHYHSHHHDSHHHDSNEAKPLASELPIPDCGFIKTNNTGEGFTSIGWLFAADKVFDHKALNDFFNQLKVLRMKAVIKTDAGCFSYNLTEDGLTIGALVDCLQSRIEMISTTFDDGLEAQLMACLTRPPAMSSYPPSAAETH